MIQLLNELNIQLRNNISKGIPWVCSTIERLRLEYVSNPGSLMLTETIGTEKNPQESDKGAEQN